MMPFFSPTRVATGLLAATLAVHPAAAQEPVVITLGGAARFAAQKSAGPDAARARAEQADARTRQRTADLLPNISFAASDGDHTFNSASFGINFADPTTGKFLFDPNGQVLGPVRTWDFRATARQSLADFGSIARVHAAQASALAADAEVSSASQQAAAVAAAAYVRAVRADAQVEARIADSTLATELLGIARDQVTAGVGVALDVTRAQSQLATTRAQLIAARSERDRALLELHRALSLPLTTPITLADSLPRLTESDALPSETQATDRALHLRADLRAASQQIAAAERQITAIKAERLPALSAFADQGSTGKGADHLLPTYEWGLMVTVPVFDGFRREGRIDEQRSTMRELDVRRRDLEQQTAIEVREALLDLASAREQVTASGEQLTFATQELSQARDRFTAGIAGNADVITASLGLNAARTQLIDARMAFQSARVALARAQGIVTDLP